MNNLAVPWELKATDEQNGLGRFTGLGSVYGVLDLHGDVVMKGAFSKSLAQKGGFVPLLWMHDTREPIGLAKLTDTDKGLQVDGEIDLDIPEGKRAYSAVKRRYVKGLSIGYDALKDQFRNGKRELHEIDLWEMSIVTFGANPQAVISNVKAQVEALELATAIRTALNERTEMIKGIGSSAVTAEDDELLRMLTLNFIRRMREVASLHR